MSEESTADRLLNKIRHDRKRDRQIKIGLTVLAVGTILILEKRRVDKLLRGSLLVIGELEEMSQEAVRETMETSFDAGVEWGMAAAKKLLQNAPVETLGKTA